MKTFSKTPSLNEQTKKIPCPICQGKEFKLRWNVKGSLFVQCRCCGVLLQNPQPVPDALAIRYDSEYCAYEVENEEAFFKLMMLGLSDARFFEQIVPTLPEPKRILDVGCATGRLLAHFQEKGWQTSGVDLCSESISYARDIHKVDARTGRLEDISFPNAHFSVVHASHLIEHIDNPAAFVREVHRILAPGGVFICVTPTFDGLQAKLFGENWRSLISDHVTLFNRRTLTRLFVNSELKPEIFRTWGGLAVGSAPRWLKKIVDYWAKKLGFGDVMLMSARRKNPLKNDLN